MPGDESMRTALGTCDGCGEELYPRIVHACPVLGTDVVATPIDPDDESMRTE